MLPASLYHPVYLLIVTFLTFYAMQMYNQRILSNQERTMTSKQMLALLICLFMIFFIGLRPTSGRYFVDMASYNEIYSILLGDRFYFEKEAENLFFDNWFAWMASNFVDFSTVMQIFAAIYFATSRSGVPNSPTNK